MNWLTFISGTVFIFYSFSFFFNYKNWIYKRHGDSEFVTSWKKRISIAYLNFGITGVILSFKTIPERIIKVVAFIMIIDFLIIAINNIIFKKDKESIRN